jgi:hypothetical protein
MVPYDPAIPLLAIYSRERVCIVLTDIGKNVQKNIVQNSPKLEICHMSTINRMVKETAIH